MRMLDCSKKTILIYINDIYRGYFEPTSNGCSKVSLMSEWGENYKGISGIIIYGSYLLSKQKLPALILDNFRTEARHPQEV